MMDDGLSAGNYKYVLPVTTRWHNFCQNVRYSFVPTKPLLTFRLVKKTLEAFILRKAVPRQIELALDYACNLNCSHCSSKRLIRSPKELMTVDEYRLLYAQLKKLGIVSYIFTGGEPLFFLERLLSILPVFQPKQNLLSIQSNTTLLNDQVAKELKQAGVDLILGSVDSFHAQDDDASISLDAIGETIALARRHGLDMTYCTVLTHANINSPQLNELISFMKRQRVLLFFNVAVPVGAWTNKSDVVLTSSDQLRLRELTRLHPHTRFDFASNFGGFGCPAFKERLYITPYGDVLGCPFLQISLGNLKSGANVADIRDKAMRSPYFNHYHKLCLAGEDPQFMDFYIPRHNNASQLPLAYEELEFEIINPDKSIIKKMRPGMRAKTFCDWCQTSIATPVTGQLRDEESQQHLPEAFKKERFQFVRCDHCGLVRLADRPHKDDMPLYYSSEYCCFQDYEQRGRIMHLLAKWLSRRKIKQIQSLMPASSSILLDYGCGSGTWLRMINEQKPPWRLIGTDIAHEALTRLRQVAIEAYVCDESNVRHYISEKSVGVIHLFHVIEHVPSPIRLLEVLYTLLVPGGHIIGQTPNYAALEVTIFKDAWNQWHVPRHFTIFDKKKLRRHAEKIGFEVISIKDSLSAATQWSGSFTKWAAMQNNAPFRGTSEPLYPLLTLVAIPLTAIQIATGLETSHQDFIFRKPS